MTNSFRALLSVCALVLSGVLIGASACSESHDDGGSSGSHWLACDQDDDCSTAQDGASCDSEGYCVDESGERIVSAPLSAGGGSGGGGRGDASIDAGADSGPGSNPADDAGAGLADANANATPGCDDFVVGDVCELSSDIGWACCAEGIALSCDNLNCLTSYPALCTGTVAPREPQEACVVGPEPGCAGKGCGDLCDPCDGRGAECVIEHRGYSCTPDGACRYGVPRCVSP